MTDQLRDPTGLFGRKRAGADAGDSEPAGSTEALGFGRGAAPSPQGAEPLLREHQRGVDGGVRAASTAADLHRREAEDLAPLDDILDGIVLGRGDENPV